MKIDTFNILWENFVYPIGTKIASLVHGDFRLDNEQLHMEYQRQKSVFRLFCNKIDYDEDDPKTLLDRHKACAALCVALLRTNPIKKYEPVADYPIDLGELSKHNEQLAAAVSLRTLEFFICCEETPDNLNEYFKRPYNLPKPQDPREGYGDAFTRTLFFSNLSGNIDLFLLAHIFFMIEQYLKLSDSIAEK